MIASSLFLVAALAQSYVEVCRSPNPTNIFCYAPGICRMESGRLVATCDWDGPGAKELGPRSRVYLSDDKGATWRLAKQHVLAVSRPFVSGGKLWLLGQRGDLGVMGSDDGGETWGEPGFIGGSLAWHEAPCNVWYANGCVYMAVERRCSNRVKKHWWPVAEFSPVLLRAKEGADLTKRESWTQSRLYSFQEAMPGALEGTATNDYFGVPFYTPDVRLYSKINPRKSVPPAPIGWLEANVVRFDDPHHIWHDPTGHTFYFWCRAHTASTGYAAIAKVVELADGTMRTEAATVPSGKRIVFVPCPGGQMKFHVLYDDVTKLFWLLSSQATDSMCKYETMNLSRIDLPNNERNRLQLHFSKNMVDWCFAGLVAMGEKDREARHYASMCIDGDDLCVLSRSGDLAAKDPHNGNLITFHRIENFRSLVY